MNEDKLKFSVIVPVYNNGDFLLEVCFRSLKESSMFNEMEIILVDDGSSDNNTLEIIKGLEKQYYNVKSYFFETGGSGSPSRPRNYGLLISTTNFITYLDPDNEAINDGYAKLYKAICSSDYEIVAGNIDIIGKKSGHQNYYNIFRKSNNGNDTSCNGKEILIRTNFVSLSTQALMVKKDFLLNNKLKMVEGALGEDTLFFYELLINSKSIKVINEDIHIYYNSNEGSLVNTINKHFYNKYLILEQYKRELLEKHELLDMYLEDRYDMYYKLWYLDKLKNVVESDIYESQQILDKIYMIYKDVWVVKDKELIKYLNERGLSCKQYNKTNSDYKLYKEIKIDENNNLWFSQQTKLSKLNNNKFKSNLDTNKYEYISIYEKNTFFDIKPSNAIEIIDEYIYNIEFYGENHNNLDIRIYAILYSKEGRQISKYVNLNNSLSIYPVEGVKFLRLAIRIEGKGEFSLNNINILHKKKEKVISYNDIKDLKIACVFDEFTMQCYKDMCHLIVIDPNRWREQFENNRPDMLFVESAWRGNYGLWEYKIAVTRDQKLQTIKQIVQWCKDRKIPTVFWNKEDPIHFNIFIKVAKYFDYIFTTEEKCIDMYIKATDNKNVHPLLFAAQPKIHNPIKYIEERNDKACFSGSYYAKYQDRCIDMETIINAAVNTIGVDIYDRHHNSGLKLHEFPDKFSSFIQGKLLPSEMYKANKGYRVMLNVNSVKESNTMFSRRVFEGLACGTPVVSTYSKGIMSTFGDLVVATDNQSLLEAELDKLKNNEEYYNIKSVEGIRCVLSEHTYLNRLDFILEKIGINIKYMRDRLAIICTIDSLEQFDKLLDLYNTQTYNNKELIVITDNEYLHSTIIQRIEYVNIKIILNNRENYIIDLTNAKYLGFINLEKNIYGENYFEDLMNATLYTEAEFIGKKSYLKDNGKYISKVNGSMCFEYVTLLDLDKCIINLELLKEYTVKDFLISVSRNYIDKFKYGYRYFSIDNNNLIEKE